MAHEQDSELLGQALAGDPKAVTRLVDALYPVVQRRVARALLLSGQRRSRALRPDVEDMTQDVLLSLFADGASVLRAWDSARGLSLAGFVGLVAQRQVLGILRSRKRSPFSEEPVAPHELDESRVADTPTQLRFSESRQMLQFLALKLRERLSPLGLTMFYRLCVSQETVETVSQETGLGVEAIYQWKSRIKKAALEVEHEFAPETPRPSGTVQPESSR